MGKVTIIPKKRLKANQLTKADREFWKALQASGKASFTNEDFRDIVKSIGRSERSAKRYVENLRANGKLGIQHVYNLYY
jgi:DNA-binding Lrp family transcriptional regulator